MHPDVIAATLDAVMSARRDDAGEHKSNLKIVNAQLDDLRAQLGRCIDAITQKSVPEFLPDLRIRAKEFKDKESVLLQQQQDLSAQSRLQSAQCPSETGVTLALHDFTEKVNRLSAPERKELVQLLLKDAAVFASKVPAGHEADGVTRRLRFVFRLRLAALMPPDAHGATGTLPMQFTVDVLKKRKGHHFRYVEPFGADKTDADPIQPEPVDDKKDMEFVASHPLIQVTALEKEMGKDRCLKQAHFAQRIGKTRALVCSYFRLLKLDKHVRTVLTTKPSAQMLRYFSLRKLLTLVRLPPADQLKSFREQLK